MGEIVEDQDDAFEALRRRLAERSRCIEDLLKPGRKFFDNARVLEKVKAPGGRFKLAPDFSCFGPVGQRPISKSGERTIHVKVGYVQSRAKRVDGKLVKGSGVNSSTKVAFIEGNDALNHERYITDKAAEHCGEKLFAGYLEPASIQEQYPSPELPEAVFSNISDDKDDRLDFWCRIGSTEKVGKPDRLKVRADRITPEILALLASIDEVPAAKIRRIRSAMSKPESKQPVISFELDREHARPLIAAAQKLPSWNSAEPALAKTEGRGGRTQYRIVLELPDGITRHGRERVLARLCERLDQARVMYTGVVHAPDPHNDQRNYHAHVILYDRPCRYLSELGRWDFELPKETDKDGVYIGGRADKSDLFKTSGNGNFFEVGRDIFSDFRARWVEDCNVEIARAGLPVRYHAGTFQDLGIDQEPSEHVGNDDAALGAVGIRRPKIVENNRRGWRGEHQRLLNRHEQTRAERATPIDEARAVLAKAGATPPPVLEARIIQYQSAVEALAASEEQRDQFFLEWDIAKSSALKTRDTCRNLLSGLGKQGRKRIPDEALIRERRAAAQAFLDGIDAKISPLAGQAIALGGRLERESQALAKESDAIVVALEQVRLTRGVSGDGGIERTIHGAIVGGEQLTATPRETLKQEFDRILERIKQEALVVDVVLRSGKPAYHVEGLLAEEQRTIELSQFKFIAREWLATRHAYQTLEIARLEAYARQNTGSFLNLTNSDESSGTIPKVVRARYHKYRDHPRLKRLVHDLASKQASVEVEALAQAELTIVPVPPLVPPPGDLQRQVRSGIGASTGDGNPTAHLRQSLPIKSKLETISKLASQPPADMPGIADVSNDGNHEGPRAVPPPNSIVEAGRPMPASQQERGLSREITREPSGPDHVPDSPAVNTVGGVAPTDTNMGNENEHHDAKRRRHLLARGRVFDHLHRPDTAAGVGCSSTADFPDLRTLSSLDLVRNLEGAQVSMFQVRDAHLEEGRGPDRAMQLPGDSLGATGTGAGAVTAHQGSSGINEAKSLRPSDGVTGKGHVATDVVAVPIPSSSTHAPITTRAGPPEQLQEEAFRAAEGGEKLEAVSSRSPAVPFDTAGSELLGGTDGESYNGLNTEGGSSGPATSAEHEIAVANAIVDAGLAREERVREAEQAREAALVQSLSNKGKGR